MAKREPRMGLTQSPEQEEADDCWIDSLIEMLLYAATHQQDAPPQQHEAESSDG